MESDENITEPDTFETLNDLETEDLINLVYGIIRAGSQNEREFIEKIVVESTLAIEKRKEMEDKNKLQFLEKADNYLQFISNGVIPDEEIIKVYHAEMMKQLCNRTRSKHLLHSIYSIQETTTLVNKFENFSDHSLEKIIETDEIRIALSPIREATVSASDPRIQPQRRSYFTVTKVITISLLQFTEPVTELQLLQFQALVCHILSRTIAIEIHTKEPFWFMDILETSPLWILQCDPINPRYARLEVNNPFTLF